MKIAVVAHIRHPIAEPFMGGMEAHSRMLCDGLRRNGHDVVLFASARSSDMDLVPVCQAPYEDVLPWRVHRGTPELACYQDQAFAYAWQRIVADGFDVVHNNSLYPGIIGWAVRDNVPCVSSQHVPPFGKMREAVEASAADPIVQHTVTSRDQMSLWSARAQRNMAVVHNGVETDRWQPGAGDADYLVWAGRITPNKGTSHAVRAARLGGLPMHVFGPVEDARYFTEEVEPFLADGVEYHGHVSLATLRPIIGRARGMVVTPLWDEPFGLVAAEALSCGTPVCAFDNGALAEVVGDCGHVVPPRDVEALADAMGRIDAIDRNACRKRALERFSSTAMITGYERAYERAVDALLHQAARPFASSHSSTSALLA